MGGGPTRREFLTTATAGAVALAAPVPAAAKRKRRRRPTVAVLGGGIAGLTAAHELIERGYDVTVYERRAWGGKARSVDVPGSAAGGRAPLPGEHGWRIFFGFYQSNPDTFRRIPYGGGTVFDHLVGVPRFAFGRAGQRDLLVPANPLDPSTLGPDLLEQTVLGLALESGLPPDGAAYLARKLAVYLSSCAARRRGQWEHTPWTEFIQVDRWGGDYRQVFAEAFTHFLQASRAEDTSTDFVGLVLESILYNLAGRNSNGPMDRIFDGPTSEAFITPWTRHLRDLGARLRLGHEVVGLRLGRSRIREARVRGPKGVRPVRADWYVCALPAERARALWTSPILEAAPDLAGMFQLGTGWMNGMQFYLRSRPELVAGHYACMHSPWKVSFILQTPFWTRDFPARYGDGDAKECLSAIVSDWEAPGLLTGKPARVCSDAEIREEVWTQIKRHVNDHARVLLTDDLVLGFHLDPGLVRRGGSMHNDDPLVLPEVGAWDHRPEAGTGIENLVLAGDYPRGEALMANMEAANSGGRVAANVVLERSGSREPRVGSIFTPYQPPEWAALKRVDEERWAAGQPNLLDDGAG